MRILQVVHGFPPGASGGTEVYVRDLAAALAAGGLDDVAVLTRHEDPRSRELQIRRTMRDGIDVFSINNTFQTSESFEESYANHRVEAIAATILDEWRPDVVHVQHLTCLSTGIPRQAARRGIPVVMTLNDYWLICHRGQLLDLDGRVCDGPGEQGCGRCMPPAFLASVPAFRAGRAIRSLPIPGAAAAFAIAARAWSGFISDDRTRAATRLRLRHMQDAVADIQLFLAPSDTLSERFLTFGIPRDRLIRCDQGIARARYEGLDRHTAPHLRIGFAGGLLPTKGADVLLDAIDQLPPASVVVDLLGGSGAYHGDDKFGRALRPRLGHPAIRRLGPVPHERMPGVFEDLDVLVVPSIWIENAPFIIREAFAAGLPVLASNLGGMAEMVRHEVDGLLFTAGDPAALGHALQRLLDEPGLLQRLRSGIVKPISMEEDAAWLRKRYAALASAEPHSTSTKPHVAGEGFRTEQSKVFAVVLNYRTPEQTVLAVRSLQQSDRPPDRIVVVDNDSGDGSADVLRRTCPTAQVISPPENLGFAGGCNLGIRLALEAGAEYVLLVNSDAVVAPDAIDHLMQAFLADSSLGIAAPVLLSREEPDQVSSAGIQFSERTARMRHRLAGRRFSALGTSRVHDVDAVSGCVMLIRRGVFERSGLLDDEYFFSFEDVDFCLRARAAGFGTACVQDARAYHEGGRTIGRRSPRRVYFATRNHLRLAARIGSAASRPFRAGLVVALNAAYVLVSPEVPLIGGTIALVRGTWHHLRGRYGRA